MDGKTDGWMNRRMDAGQKVITIDHLEQHCALVNNKNMGYKCRPDFNMFC